MDNKYDYVYFDNPYIFLASYENYIDVFNSKTKIVVNTFSDLKYYSGGNRVRYSDIENKVCLSSYYIGLAVYNILNQQMIWYNNKIKKIEDVFFCKNLLIVSTQKKEMHILSISDGMHLNTINNVYQIYATDNALNFIVQAKKELKLLSFKENDMNLIELKEFKVEESFHCITMIKSNIVIHRLFDSLRCYAETGDIIWESDIPKGYIVNSMKFNTERNSIVCGARYNNNIRMLSFIININYSDGLVLNKLELRDDVIEFDVSKDGKEVICSNGQIIDSFTGVTLHQI